MGKAWLYAIIVLAVITVAAVSYLWRVHGSSSSSTPQGLIVAVYDCGNTSLFRLVEEAASKVNGSLMVVEYREGVQPSILVVDAQQCFGAGLAGRAARVLAGVLLRGGVVLLVGRPWEVSSIIKAQHRVLMAYPLPKVNMSIIYYVRVVKVLTETVVAGEKGVVVAPEVNYWKGVSLHSMVSALEFALRALRGPR